MRAVIWLMFCLMALLWSGGAFVAAEVGQWASQALSSGDMASLGRELARLPPPEWLAPWVDPALIDAMREGLVWTIEALRGAIPMVGSAVGWLVPLIWVLWAVGLTVLLLLAGAAHFFVGRTASARSQAR